MWIQLLAHAGEGGGGHFPPLHPLLVNFTAGLVPVSVAADLVGRWWDRASLRSVGFWTLMLAAAATPLTALFGWLWMRSMSDMDHWQMPYHRWIGIGLAVVIVGLAVWRGWFARRQRVPGVAYLVAAVLVVGALAVQGDLGGSMSFGGGIIFAGEKHEHETPQPAGQERQGGEAGPGHHSHSEPDAGHGSAHHHDATPPSGSPAAGTAAAPEGQ